MGCQVESEGCKVGCLWELGCEVGCLQKMVGCPPQEGGVGCLWDLKWESEMMPLESGVY